MVVLSFSLRHEFKSDFASVMLVARLCVKGKLASRISENACDAHLRFVTR